MTRKTVKTAALLVPVAVLATGGHFEASWMGLTRSLVHVPPRRRTETFL